MQLECGYLALSYVLWDIAHCICMEDKFITLMDLTLVEIQYSEFMYCIQLDEVPWSMSPCALRLYIIDQKLHCFQGGRTEMESREREIF